MSDIKTSETSVLDASFQEAYSHVARGNVYLQLGLVMTSKAMESLKQEAAKIDSKQEIRQTKLVLGR